MIVSHPANGRQSRPQPSQPAPVAPPGRTIDLADFDPMNGWGIDESRDRQMVKAKYPWLLYHYFPLSDRDVQQHFDEAAKASTSDPYWEILFHYMQGGAPQSMLDALKDHWRVVKDRLSRRNMAIWARQFRGTRQQVREALADFDEDQLFDGLLRLAEQRPAEFKDFLWTVLKRRGVGRE